MATFRSSMMEPPRLRAEFVRPGELIDADVVDGGIHNVGGGIEYIGGAAGLWLIGSSLRDRAAAAVPGMAFTGAAAIVAAAVVAMSIPALFRWRGAVQRVAETLLFAALVSAAYLLESRGAAV